MADFMSGLLGIGQEEDPRAAAQRSGLLGIASQLLSAGGPSLTPTSFGQALGPAILGGRQMAQQSMTESSARQLQQQKIKEEAQFKQMLPQVFVDGKPDYTKLQQLVSMFPERGRVVADALQKAAGPDTIQVDVGNEIQIRTKQGDIVSRIPKGLAPQAPQRETFLFDKDLGMFVGSLGSTRPLSMPDGSTFKPTSKISLDAPTQAFMQSKFGTTDFTKLNPEQQNVVQIFKNAPSGTDAEKLRVEGLKAQDEFGIPVAPIITREQLLQGVTPPTGTTTPQQTQTSAPVTLPPDVASAPLKPNEVPLIESTVLTPKQKRDLVLSRPTTMGSVEYVVNTNRQMRNTIKEILNNPGFNDAFGLGGETKSKVPGSPAANVRSRLEQLQGNLFIEALTAMRSASKTGAAVGSVTEKEGDKLQASRAAIQQFQSAESARQELNRLLKQLDDAEKNTVNAFSRTYGKTEFNFAPLAPPSGTNRKPLNSIFGG
jgi:hypothetical protein